MGIVVSLLLIGVGAILTWAVSAEAEGIDVNAVGVILMIIGVLAFFLTLFFWQTWLGAGAWRGRSAYVEGAPRRRYRGARRTIVEEEAPPRATYVEEDVPPGGPPPPP